MIGFWLLAVVSQEAICISYSAWGFFYWEELWTEIVEIAGELGGWCLH